MRSHRKGWRVGGFAGRLTLGLVASGFLPGVAVAAGRDAPATGTQTGQQTPSTSPATTSASAETPTTTRAATPAIEARANAPAAAESGPAWKDPLPSPYPGEADGLGPRLGPRYRLLRSAEDWRFMGAAKAPEDWAGPLKAIPLDGDGDITLSFSGDQRTSVSHSTRPLMQDTQSRTEWLSRTDLSADLRIGPSVRVYGQLLSAHIWGKNETAHVPVWENDLIVQQLFGELRVPVASGVARVTVGRQEFFDGPRFVISPRENPNVRVSMNGARLSMDWSKLRFTVFDFVPTRQGNGVLDDGIGNGEHLSGGVASLVLARDTDAGRNSAVYLDPFYFHYTREQRTSGPISGSDRRETWGARLWGHWGPVAFDWSVLKQDGRFAERPVDALAVSTNQSVALGRSRMAPRLGFHADYASGGGTYTPGGKVSAFNVLYNATIIFSDNNYVGGSNVLGAAPTLRLPLTRKLTFQGEAGFYWRPNENDAAYRGNSVPYAGTQNVEGRHIANIARARLDWSPDPHIVLSGIANYVDAGKVLTRAGYDDNLFLMTRLTLRF